MQIPIRHRGQVQEAEYQALLALPRIAAALETIAAKYTNPAKFEGKWMTETEAKAFRASVGDKEPPLNLTDM